VLDGHFIGIGVAEDKYDKTSELIAENSPEERRNRTEMK
jgi:hypothetical protein